MRTCRWEIEARRTAAAIVPLAFLVLIWPQSADGKELVKPQAVNLRVDHLVSLPPGAQLVNLRLAMRRTPEIFATAARGIGLTSSEYQEVLLALDRRAVTFGPLPLHLDRMSGLHAGRVYVVREAVVPAKTVGWRIVLADGALVFIPQTCGNLSLLRHADNADRTATSVVTKTAESAPAEATAAGTAVAIRANVLGTSTSLGNTASSMSRTLIVVDAARPERMMDEVVVGARRYVSVRDIFVQMGATINDSRKGMTVTGRTPKAIVSVTAGQRRILVNGHHHLLAAPAIIARQALFVPIYSFISVLAATGALDSRATQSALEMRGQRRPHGLSGLNRVPRPPGSAGPSKVNSGASTSPVVIPVPGATSAPAVSGPGGAHGRFTLPVVHGFLEAAFWRPPTYNEFSAGTYCSESFLVRGALEIRKLAFSFDYRQAVYVTSDNALDTLANHYTQFTSIQADTEFVPVFRARQSTFEARVGYQIASPNVYVGASVLRAANNYGYPELNAVGVGIEKLPTTHSGFNVFGSVYVYPLVRGSFRLASGDRYQQRYSIATFDVGTTFIVPHAPVYVYAGYSADRYRARLNAPIGQIHAGPYLGLGVKW